MSGNGPTFELPRKVEHFLAALSRLYAQEGKKQQQAILVNSHIRIVEEWTTDNWDGGRFGHALYLVIPEALYFTILKNKEAVQTQIKDGINNLHNIQSEFIDLCRQ